ncbi:MAG: hypothetical protein WKF58_17040 [Ilumatobacteraceae bacterium]
MGADGLDGVYGTGVDTSRNVIAVNVDRPAEQTLATLARRAAARPGVHRGRDRGSGERPAARRRVARDRALGDNGNVATDTLVSCDAGASFPVGQLDELTPVDDAEDAAIGDALDSFLRTVEGEYWPQESWYVLARTDDACS